MSFLSNKLSRVKSEDQRPSRRRRTSGLFAKDTTLGRRAMLSLEPLEARSLLTVGGAGGGSINFFGDEDQTNQDDTFLLIRDPADTTMLQFFLNGNLEFEGTMANIPQVNVWGAGGNDTLIVDSTNGLISVAQGIRYDGDNSGPNFFGGEGAADPGFGGFDQLILQQDGGVPDLLDETLFIGATAGSGRDTIVAFGTGETQRVDFQFLEPITTNVPALTFNISSVPGLASLLDASNAINYTDATQNVGGAFTFGRITVDNFEPIEFTNKNDLNINAGAGNDTVNLAYHGTTDPTGLATISALGGDPGEFDTLVVTGTGAAETFLYAGNGSDSGTLEIPGVDPDFDAFESVVIDGRSSGAADTLIVRTPSDNDRITFVPGANLDSGVFHISSNLDPQSEASLTFRALGRDGFIQLLDSTLAGDRTDTFEYLGTSSSDTFTVTPADGGTINMNSGAGGVNARKSIRAPGVANLVLSGLNGDDTFNIAGAHPFATIIVDAGDPSASDTTVLTAATGPVTVNLADPELNTNTTVTGYGGTISLLGVERANLDVAGNTLTVVGKSNDDEITYTPTGPAAGNFSAAGLNTAFSFTTATSTFTVGGGAGGLADTLIVRGSNGRDRFQIDQGTRIVDTFQQSTLMQFKTVTLAANIETLTVLGLAGQDSFQVTPAVGVGISPRDNLVVNIDGGSPTASDSLVLRAFGGGTLPANNFVVVKRNQDLRSGVVRTFIGAAQRPTSTTRTSTSSHQPSRSTASIRTCSSWVRT